MIRPTGSKNIFQTGTKLDPDDLVDEFDFCNDILMDVQEQRLARGSVTYSFQPFSNLTYSSDPEQCRIRFRIPTQGEVENVWVGAYYQSTVPIDGYLMDSNLLAITSITSPYFQLPATDGYASSYNDVVAQQPFRITSGTDYVIEMRPNSTGTFTFRRLDLTVTFKTDIYDFAEVTPLSRNSYQFIESSHPDATVINTNVTALSTKASAHNTALNNSSAGARPMLFQIQGITSATSAILCTSLLPTAPSTGKMTIISHSLWTVWNTSAGTKTLQVDIKNRSAASIFSLSTSATAGNTHSGANSSTTKALKETIGPGNEAEDYSVVFSVTAGTATIIRAYYLIWVI